MKLRIKILLGIIAFFIFVSLSIYITFPLIFHLGDFAVGHGDELVIAWIQSWVIHALSSGNIFSLFNANIFYPYHNSLAFSDIFLTSSILSIIPLYIIKEPISVVNFTFISSLILLGFSIFLLSYYLTKDFVVSILSGNLVLFTPAVLDKATHLQILAIQWVPLSILFFLIFIKQGKSKYFALGLIFFLLQIYNSFLPGYFIVISYVIISIFNIFYDKKKSLKLLTKMNISLLLIAFALTIPIIIPYYQVSKEFSYTRDIRDSIHFALQPEDLFYSSNYSRLNTFLNDFPINKNSQNNEFKPGYLGIVFTILSIFVLYYFIKNFRKNNKIFNSLTTISLIGLVLSFGPVLHLGRQTIHEPFPIPLPYTLFYYILPGFNGFRNSARWEMLFILCIAVVIALTLTMIFKNYNKTKTKIIYCLLIIGIIAEYNFPMKLYAVPQVSDFPPVYKWLNTTPADSAVIILPIHNWNSIFAVEEIWREYYSTANFRKTVNGYSGFSPPPWQKLVVDINNDFPQENSIIKLKKIGVDYIIVHKSEFDLLHKNNFKLNMHPGQMGNEIITSLAKSKKLHLIKKIGNDYIYEL